MRSGQPHIAVDARMIADGGIGTYLQHVVPRLAQLRPEWRFTVLGNRDRLRGLGWSDLPDFRLAEAGAGIYSFREQVEMPLRCPSDADVYWVPHYNMPVLMHKPTVVTVHDVCHLALPEGSGGPLRRLYAKAMFTWVRARARAILFDSEFSRAEMNRLVGAGSGAWAVSPLGVAEEWFHALERAPRPPMREPYFVYVGNLKRHKNVPMLVRAFRDVQDKIPHRLVIVGRGEGLRVDPEIPEEIRAADDRVRFAGELSGEALRQHVAHADAFVTASLYEGFGLPPLEAMAAGRPCVVSSAGSLPEVCGDAALYCDPRSRESIAARLLEIATDEPLRARLIARGRARAQELSWDRCAARTAALFDTVLA